MITKKNPIKDKKRITYFFLITTIILILNTQLILGEDTPLPPFPTTTQNTDITNIIIQENIKTRMEIKQYCDQKISSMVELVKTEGADIIGRNFAEFDKRIHELSQKIFIKIILGTFTTLLLAQLIFYIIKRKIEKKHMPRATIIKEIPISPTQAGIIIKEKTQELTPPIPPSPYQEKELPTFPELQQPILLSPKEREKILREQEEIDKRKKEEAQKKLKKLIKEQNKKRKKLNKIEKKLDKPEQIKRQLDNEHTTLQKQIEEISQQYQIPTEQNPKK